VKEKGVLHCLPEIARKALDNTIEKSTDAGGRAYRPVGFKAAGCDNPNQ
jgi:predicted lactoylglutathione lyase